MGIDVGGKRHGVHAAINITPLVDVVLVLLIIFMVVVPAVQRQIPVEVPPEAAPGVVPAERPIRVEVQGDLSVVLDDKGTRTELPGVDLAVALRSRLDQPGASSTVFVDVAAPVRWKDAVAVMDTIRGLGGPDHTISVALELDGLDGASR